MKHFKFVFQNPHFVIVIDIYRLGYEAIESYKRTFTIAPFAIKKNPFLIKVTR